MKQALPRRSGPHILLAGHLTCDQTPQASVPGGCVYYAGRTYRALGEDARAKVTLATSAARDYPHLPALEGLDVRMHQAPATTTFENRYRPHEARVQYLQGIAAPVGPDLAPSDGTPVDILHLAPVYNELHLGSWLDAIPARLVVLSPQGWMRRHDGPAPTVQEPARVLGRPWQPRPEDLQRTDVVCVSEEDLQGQGDLLALLRAHVRKAVVLTLGERGSWIFAGPRSLQVGIYPVHVTDPTGAGDVYAAALAWAMLEALPLADAARRAAAAASIVIEGHAGDALERVGEASGRALRVQVREEPSGH